MAPSGRTAVARLLRGSTAIHDLAALRMRPDEGAAIAAQIEEEVGDRGQAYACAGARWAREAADQGVRIGNRVTPVHMGVWIVDGSTVPPEGPATAIAVHRDTLVSLLTPEPVTFPVPGSGEMVSLRFRSGQCGARRWDKTSERGHAVAVPIRYEEARPGRAPARTELR